MDEEFEDIEVAGLNDEEKPKLSGGRLRRVLSRWWLILLCAILGGIGGFYKYSLTPEEKYTAMGIMEIPGLQQNLVGADAMVDKRGDLQKVNTTISKLAGVSALEKVATDEEVQALENLVPPAKSWKPRYMASEEDLACKPASTISPGQLHSMLGGWVNLSQRPGTAMIDVSVTHLDRQSAIVIAKAIMENFIDSELVKKSGGAQSAVKLLKEEAEEASLELEKLEKSLKIYESAIKLSAQVTDTRNTLAQLRARYKEKHPKLIQTNIVYDDLFGRFRDEMNYIANSMEEAEYWKPRMAEIQSLEARIALGGASVPKVKQEWITIMQNSLAARASLLQTKVQNQSGIFTSLVKRIEEIDVRDGADPNDIIISEMPVITNVARSSPNQPIVLGTALGIMVGTGIAFLLSIIDYKVYDILSAEEATALSCLAAIPAQDNLKDIKDQWEPVVLSNSESPHAESIRNLRASILLLGRREQNQVLMVTSAAPSEGKTTVSGELAAALALNDERVALVDLDLRRPRVYQLFRGVKDKLGVSELFSGQVQMDSVVHSTRIEKLSVIGAGKRPPNPAELLSENEITRLIATLRNQYDRIIVDTPPILPVADARVISSYVDKVIMVVRATHSPIGAIMRAKTLLEEANAPMAGIVVNSLNSKKNVGSYKGYKGYGEYGSRGSYEYYSDR